MFNRIALFAIALAGPQSTGPLRRLSAAAKSAAKPEDNSDRDYMSIYGGGL